jgi:hypothetical protein
MTTMIRAFLAVAAAALLNGCFLFSSTAPSNYVDTPDDMRAWTPHVPEVSDRHAYGPIDGLKPGLWARYIVKRPAGEIRLALGVVSVGEGKAWIEVVEENDSRLASARLVSAEGRVLKALFREIGPRGTSAVFEQKLVQSGDAEPPAPAEETAVNREIDLLGGKRAVVVVRAIFRDEALGRSETDETTWCAGLPGLYASGPRGGLVRLACERQRLSVEMIETGTDYKPVIPDPK